MAASLVRGARRLVGAGPSHSAVARALDRSVREGRERLLAEEFRQAAKDPEFLRDIEQTMLDFAASDGETERSIP